MPHRSFLVARTNPNYLGHDDPHEVHAAFASQPLAKSGVDYLANQKELPRRFIAGADAIGTAEQKIAALQQQINALRELSTSLAFDQGGEYSKF